MPQRVLLVDDDQSLLDGLKRVLRKETYELHCLNSGKEALQLLQKSHFDVVVTDQEMPGLSGTELLQILRREHPGVIAIMLTGKANLEVALDAINSGDVYRILTKPCNGFDIALSIREALKQRELISQSRRLVDAIREQSLYIAELERQNPGITKVSRNSDGAVIVDGNLSLEEVLKEVSEELEKAEGRLSAPKGN